MFLLLFFVVSVQGVFLDFIVCLVFQSVNGIFIVCKSFVEVFRRFSVDIIYLVVEFFNFIRLFVGFFRGVLRFQELYFFSNRLYNLSVELLQSVFGLKVLDFIRNVLSRLSFGFFRVFVVLYILVLKENQLRVLDVSGLYGFTVLRYLDLFGNQFRTLFVGLLVNVFNLRVFDFSDNQLEVLFFGFLRGFLCLEWLYLEGNRLRVFVEDFLAFQVDLRYFFLSDNKLVKVVFDVFRGLRRLDMLDLFNNFLISVFKGFWVSLGRFIQNLQYGFDFFRNFWVCDGYLYDFFRWFVDNKEKMFFQNDTRCVGSEVFKGQTFLEVVEFR